MKLTCSQTNILITFYLDGELSPVLTDQVEEHLKTCNVCKEKYNLAERMLVDIKSSVSSNNSFPSQFGTSSHDSASSEQYKIFKTNLSAYIDNELENNENIKMKKFTINNKLARKELEDSYNMKKMLNDSYKKTKMDIKHDFTRSVLKQLEIEEENALNFNPAIKLLIAFTISVLVLATIVLVSLSI